MHDHPDIAAMGSQGPDITFFLDLMPVAQIWVERAIHVYEMFEDFIEPYKEAIEKLERAVDRAASRYIPGYTPLRDAIQEFGATFDDIQNTFLTALSAFASGYIDGFAYLKLPMQRGLREEGWFWFDMLHYRKTSQFAHNLYKAAGNHPKKLAYAAGYVTHLATDTTGHAYVNACAGSPYRRQWQRHHCTDNYIDVWTLAHYLKLDINNSHWAEHYPRNMDKAIREQFLQALKMTYSNIRHPDGRLLEGREWPVDGDLVRMWDMLRRAIEIQTKGYSIDPPEPPDFPIDFDACPTPPSFEDEFGERRRRHFTWRALIEALINFVKEVFEYIAKVIKWAGDQIVATTVYPIRYALYLIRLGCYHVYRACRRVLALRGYCYGHPEELEHGSRISSGFAGNLAGAVLVGASEMDYDWEKTFYMPEHQPDRQYPHKEGVISTPKLLNDAKKKLKELEDTDKVLLEACLAAGGFPQSFQYPWKYPTTALERDHSKNGPYRNGALPDAFIEKASLYRPYYHGLKTVRTTLEMVTLCNKAAKSDRQCLGNAVDLGTTMIKDIVSGNCPPDFNLDGDRGYGWLCWDVRPLGTPTRATDNFNIKNVVIGDSVGKLPSNNPRMFIPDKLLRFKPNIKLR